LAQCSHARISLESNQIPRGETVTPRDQPGKAKRRGPPDAAKNAEPRSVAAIDREAMIAEAAYYLALERGFAPGSELEDWLAAEAIVDRTPGAGGH